jgi:hypothetical protein
MGTLLKKNVEQNRDCNFWRCRMGTVDIIVKICCKWCKIGIYSFFQEVVQSHTSSFIFVISTSTSTTCMLSFDGLNLSLVENHLHYTHLNESVNLRYLSLLGRVVEKFWMNNFCGSANRRYVCLILKCQN